MIMKSLKNITQTFFLISILLYSCGNPAEIDVEKDKEYILIIHDAWDNNASKQLFQLKVE